MAVQSSVDEGKGKFTIIDLVMLIMVVGVILTIIVPLQQMRKHEAIVKGSLPDMVRIISANEQYRLNDEFGEYAWDLSLLNLRDIDTSVFTFTLTDTTVVAHTFQIGSDSTSYYYDLRDKRFRVPDDSSNLILNAWLP
jgi:type II secretory pathway pseudopilin PulG